MRYWLCIILGLIVLSACGKDEVREKAKPPKASGVLKVWALESFRKSGLEAVLIPEFENKYNCRVDLQLFESRIDLAAAVKADSASTDLILGIDNALAASDQLWDYFMPHKAEDFPTLIRESITDASYRLIPYAYSYVALIYNTRLVDSPPKSFGEMQDAKHFRQIALPDPQLSSWGAAFMHYVVSMFGEEGYEHLLRALRKNVYRSYGNDNLALDAVLSGECSMMFAMFSTAAWLKDAQRSEPEIKMQVFKEGSYLFTESAGIHRKAQNPALAEAFLKYLNGESAQKMVLYKTGLLPTHKKVMLPMAYSNLPLSVYALNDRLDRDTIANQQQAWLDVWQQVMSFM